ncbi:MAG: LacI family DNA-binding transcriptional regulator [Lachnospiraceae bacterium]|nr:LacI family DNA-binding transcriptional regulator [Lachnospiraceae bacterium]
MTIYDIAKEAGVAASTVSRVINNKPGIKAETRLKVQELIRKYNYIPDAAARGLVMQSTRMVGILIVDIRVTHHIDSAFVIEQELTKRGYCCITMSTGPTDERKAEYIQLLEQRRVEGVILMGSMFSTDLVKKSIQEHLPKVPIVIVNGYLDLPNVSGVLVDEDAGVEHCVDLLFSKGKQKIAFVLDAVSPANLKKRQGYIDGMRRHGAANEQILVYEAPESSVAGGYEATKRILVEHPDIQGIVYSIDLVAVGGIRAAYDLGFRVPEQVSLIGIDNSLYGEICMPKLTTLDNRLQELSETAAGILREGLEGNVQSRKLMLFSRIIEREST